MLSVLLWKEYREHRIVWAALAFLGAASVLSLSSMAAAGWFGAHADGQEGRFVAALLVGVYALVSGAMMLAGEIENGTLPYLDALPGFRRRLWQGKFVAGVLLVFGQIVLLMSLAAAVSLFKNWSEAAWTLASMLFAGMCGLSWGMLFSSFGRSVVNMILLALAALAVLAFIAGPLAISFAALTSVIFGLSPETNFPGYYWAGIFALAAPPALVGSALVFTGLDRRRLRAAPESMPDPKRPLHPTWSVLFWLTWRQARGFSAGLATFALFLGFVALLQPVLIWPAATLIVGVLCGATSFADEQQRSFRFLGDQRLPLGRLWLVKVGVRFGVAVAAALLVLAPSFIAALANISAAQWNNSGGPYHFIAHVFRSDLYVDLCPVGLFLTLWLVYGFAAGCLYGLLFRHGLAAGVFALFTCSVTAALWIPSLLAGGLHAWQVFGPPVLLLIATRLLMRPWAAGRIVSLTTAVRLTPFVVLAGLWLAGGIWYRVLEIPNVPQRIDVDAFRASLPTPEQDESGRLFHSACLRFDELRRSLEAQQMPQGGAAGMMGAAAAPGMSGVAGPAPMPGAANAPSPPLSPREQADLALEHGWPADDHALTVWLDKLYAGEWAPMLKQAADLPTSPFDDVRNLTPFAGLNAAQSARGAVVVLAVRGLQRQAAGDDEAYVENLRIGLALSRSLRDRTPTVEWLVGRAVQGVLVGGLDRWLENLHGRPDLIRQALALLSRYLDETADDDKGLELVEALTVKNTLDDPLSLLQEYMSFLEDEKGGKTPLHRDEAEWVATAWLIPWEQARQERILRLLFNGDQKQLSWIIHRRQDFGPISSFIPQDMTSIRLSLRRTLSAARAAQLKLALRWYQADNGKPADNLELLVPKYLPSIPIDPYDGAPIRYRLSKGEEIAWPPDPNAAPGPGSAVRKIPPGQGVLWSVGEDKVDDGGHFQAGPYFGQAVPGVDMIYLVPLLSTAK